MVLDVGKNISTFRFCFMMASSSSSMEISEQCTSSMDQTEQSGEASQPHGHFLHKAPTPKSRKGRPTQRKSQDYWPLEKIQDRLSDMSGPTLNLHNEDFPEQKFSPRNRMYFGNLDSAMSEEDFKSMVTKFGEVSEVYLNSNKNFGFATYDFFVHAQTAKADLTDSEIFGRKIRVRYSPPNSAIKVSNLDDFVTNELLAYGFHVFGDVERATVLVDVRGHPTGEGIVEFLRRQSAQKAVRICNERCFFLTSSFRPCFVQPHELVVHQEGYQERAVSKNHPKFALQRSQGPRLPPLGSFESDFGARWLSLLKAHRDKEQSLKEELHAEMRKLEAQMEYAKCEHETEMLREQLKAREMDRDRQKQEWEMMVARAEHKGPRPELKRKYEESTMFAQAQQLNTMLEEQERQFEGFGGYSRLGVFQSHAWGHAPKRPRL